MKLIAVVTTVAKKKDARALARALVEAGLAACAHITRIESIYTWRDRLEHGKEYRVLFKTVDELYADRGVIGLSPAAHALSVREGADTSPIPLGRAMSYSTLPPASILLQRFCISAGLTSSFLAARNQR